MSEVTDGETDRESVSFAGADGARIDAWLFRPDPDVATGTTIVMAHGIGGIKSAGLTPFAKRFAAAGHTCLVFDYRHFGASGGAPRERLSIRAERDDYRRALDFARQLPETTRTMVWAARSPDCTLPGMPSTAGQIAMGSWRGPSRSVLWSTAHTRRCRGPSGCRRD